MATEGYNIYGDLVGTHPGKTFASTDYIPDYLLQDPSLRRHSAAGKTLLEPLPLDASKIIPLPPGVPIPPKAETEPVDMLTRITSIPKDGSSEYKPPIMVNYGPEHLYNDGRYMGPPIYGVSDWVERNAPVISDVAEAKIDYLLPSSVRGVFPGDQGTSGYYRYYRDDSPQAPFVDTYGIHPGLVVKQGDDRFGRSAYYPRLGVRPWEKQFYTIHPEDVDNDAVNYHELNHLLEHAADPTAFGTSSSEYYPKMVLVAPNIGSPSPSDYDGYLPYEYSGINAFDYGGAVESSASSFLPSTASYGLGNESAFPKPIQMDLQRFVDLHRQSPREAAKMSNEVFSSQPKPEVPSYDSSITRQVLSSVAPPQGPIVHGERTLLDVLAEQASRRLAAGEPLENYHRDALLYRDDVLRRRATGVQNLRNWKEMGMSPPLPYISAYMPMALLPDPY